MNYRITAIAMVGALLGTFAIAPINAVVAKQTNKQILLAARPSNSLLTDLNVDGLLSDGNNLEGTLTITKVGYDQVNKTLLVSGVLSYGTQSTGSTVSTLTQEFTNIPAELSKTSNQKQIGSCDILFLDLGPIFLDVLGLEVDLSEIILDIDAVSGSGNLLGNLLCALVGLLDGGSLSGILQIINQINVILGSL